MGSLSGVGMDYLYFPGCTLYTKAKNFDQTARNCSLLLGFELKELPEWTCCGATFPLATDNLMALLPPARLLARARTQGASLTTLCAICFNVIKRTNRLIQEDGEKREKINQFIEANYEGDLKILHYLEILKGEIGFSKVKEKLVKPLRGLKAAAYYGCMLLRPFEEMRFDDKERPTLMEDFLAALGAEPIDFPYKIECCGSFQSVASPEVATECAYKILNSAVKHGAEVVISTCPMCTFNIDHKQADIKEHHLSFKPVPVLYFTQVLGMAMGLGVETLGFEQNFVDPIPLLREKGLL
ncbi:MAG: CoB--CoM heterodisulfide reductase iron-sulfur subunit B family protein [Desulfobacterota bacterium]|nr:CoB--CoM heterodisulfide reductase iron-sulfur subunit B family protein [Thermodesulfobacteriota bacterium]